MATTKKNEETRDRTVLAGLWARAVADLDEARENLARAAKAEREAWNALDRSRRTSVPSEDT